MSDNPFRSTEEASDARFNMPHTVYPTEEQIDAGGYRDQARQSGSFGQVLADAAERIEAFKGTELSFSFPHIGGVFTQLSRASLSDFDNLDLIDLRVLRAHLEEASFLIANAIARHEQQR